MSYDFTDKYQRLCLLYQSPVSSVWLVRSRKQQRLFVAKMICTQVSAADIFLEAELLRELRHPAIPVFYELMKENTRVILIEEYLFGVSLHQYLLYHQTISQETFLSFAIQLCEIVFYLHSHRPNPILYLDMKSEHIIVCGNQLKIIDFGIANYLPISGKIIQKFGTKKYAAPEQRSGKPLGFYTDVYGVGKVLEEMQKHLKPMEQLLYNRVVKKATRKKQNRRIQNIQELLFELKKDRKISRILAGIETDEKG